MHCCMTYLFFFSDKSLSRDGVIIYIYSSDLEESFVEVSIFLNMHTNNMTVNEMLHKPIINMS
jgi:hypothetical protein